MMVCLVVLARNVRALEFFVVLMGDDADAEPDITYYQRLLATDQAEAAELVAARAKTHTLPQVYDEILVPALTYANKDRRAGRLTEEEARFVVSATRDIVADLHAPEGTPTEPPAAHAVGEDATRSMSRGRILGIAAVDEADEVALRMLHRLLDVTLWDMEIAAPLHWSEVVARVGEGRPTLVCIAALPPGGAAQARHLSKRLRSAFPDIKILVGRWGLNGSVDAAQAFLSAGADHVGLSLRETAVQVGELLPVPAETRDPESVVDLLPLRPASALAPSLST